MKIPRFAGSFVAVACAVGFVAACGDDEMPTPPVDNRPTIQLTSPTGGEAVQPGEMIEIAWVANDDNMVVGVDLSYTAQGVAETSIVTGQTGSNYMWTVPSQDLLGLTVTAVATDDAGQTSDPATSPIFAVVAHSARGYVTSTTCQECHADKWDDIFMSGHPYKLSKVENATPPTFPFSEVPVTPEGFTWDDISYVIGGYGWKARFMDLQGYILVTGLTGVPTQLNLPRADLGGGLDSAWVDYHSADVDPKPYNCGRCHTTGWLDITENGGVNQDDLPGILGTWEETGITCERCHGFGVDHVASQSASDINIDQGAELCGQCHFRDTNHNILASGGFIRHHEQFDELISNGKQTFGCVDCHEPHIGVRYGNAALGGIHTTCEDCHAGQTVQHLPIDCESCHMARATKSARSVHTFEGDIRTHIFAVNPMELPKDSMFFEDPETGATHTRPFVTLDFACYACHTDPVTLEGGGGSQRTLAELSARAMVIHDMP